MSGLFDPQGIEPAFTASPRWASAYRMRWKRRRLLFRAWRKRKQIEPVIRRTQLIRPDDVLLFATVRNEETRLPHFLQHYRDLGVAHFLIVDNASTDSTRDLLADQPDVSLWQSPHSYKLSRFGMDWLTCLLFAHGQGHWCVTVDADELLVYPHHDSCGLPMLGAALDRMGRQSFGAVMLDMYPEGRLGDVDFDPGMPPQSVLTHFDPDGFTAKFQPDLDNLLIRGGVRGRVFFGAEPDRAPTLSKTPFVKWDRRYVYVSSTHSILPRHLNQVRGKARGDAPTGVLLHSKFLPEVVPKSVEEKHRGEHFENSTLYRAYYDALADDPVLWQAGSVRFEGWEQLERLGLMTRGGWD